MSEWGHCVTHHICDCKYARLEELEAENERLREKMAEMRTAYERWIDNAHWRSEEGGRELIEVDAKLFGGLIDAFNRESAKNAED